MQRPATKQHPVEKCAVRLAHLSWSLSLSLSIYLIIVGDGNLGRTGRRPWHKRRPWRRNWRLHRLLGTGPRVSPIDVQPRVHERRLPARVVDEELLAVRVQLGLPAGRQILVDHGEAID